MRILTKPIPAVKAKKVTQEDCDRIVIGIEYEPQVTLLRYPNLPVHFGRSTQESVSKVVYKDQDEIQHEHVVVYLEHENELASLYSNVIHRYKSGVDLSGDMYGNIEIRTEPCYLKDLPAELKRMTEALAQFTHDVAQYAGPIGVFLPPANVHIPRYVRKRRHLQPMQWRDAAEKKLYLTKHISLSYTLKWSEIKICHALFENMREKTLLNDDSFRHHYRVPYLWSDYATLIRKHAQDHVEFLYPWKKETEYPSQLLMFCYPNSPTTILHHLT